MAAFVKLTCEPTPKPTPAFTRLCSAASALVEELRAANSYPEPRPKPAPTAVRSSSMFRVGATRCPRTRMLLVAEIVGARAARRTTAPVTVEVLEIAAGTIAFDPSFDTVALTVDVEEMLAGRMARNTTTEAETADVALIDAGLTSAILATFAVTVEVALIVAGLTSAVFATPADIAEVALIDPVTSANLFSVADIADVALIDAGVIDLVLPPLAAAISAMISAHWSAPPIVNP